MNYNEHTNNSQSFRALTGLTYIQFSRLFPYFEVAHDDYLSEYELNGNRRSNRHRFCIYSNSPLPTIPERLLQYHRWAQYLPDEMETANAYSYKCLVSYLFFM